MPMYDRYGPPPPPPYGYDMPYMGGPGGPPPYNMYDDRSGYGRGYNRRGPQQNFSGYRRKFHILSNLTCLSFCYFDTFLCSSD